MSPIDYKKYRLNKSVELVKFVMTIGLFAFLVLRVPDQTGQIIAMAGAFILGGSKARAKLGI